MNNKLMMVRLCERLRGQT